MSKQARFRKAQSTHNQRENDKLYPSTQTMLNNCMFSREGRQMEEGREGGVEGEWEDKRKKKKW